MPACALDFNKCNSSFKVKTCLVRCNVGITGITVSVCVHMFVYLYIHTVHNISTQMCRV